MINFQLWSELIHSKSYEWFCVLKCNRDLLLIDNSEYLLALYEVDELTSKELHKLDEILVLTNK